MEELLGVSCHELYHAWNVCRIRPKELLPYDFSKEAYLDAGLLLEGVTTYMGDLYLLKSGVYDLPTYFKHLEKIIARESASFGWRNHTIIESSFDLWLDGYVQGIPDRKVNIYTHGALLAICLDSLLLQVGSSLAEVMREMWLQFGKPFKGYVLEDFERSIFDKFQDKSVITAFFADFIYGKKDLFPTLKILLGAIGIELKATQSENRLLNQFGIRTDSEGLVAQVHPDSNAYSFLMKNDEILEITSNESSLSNTFQIKRNGRNLEFTLSEEKANYFPVYKLDAPNPNSYTAIWRA
jgi:predicted metalloprotease with PDZ domain